MPRARWRALAALAVAATVGLGLVGTYSYGLAYWQHRGFAPVARLPQARIGRLLTVHFYSPALRRRADYLVYLPPGYSPRRRYPVYYLLHGAPGGPQDFISVVNLDVRLSNRLSEHQLRPMILVMPDGRVNGDTFSDSEWANTRAGAYESFVLDVVRDVDRRFAAIPARWARVIAGYSAGGYGALNIALHHPQVFANVQSWSGYFVQSRRFSPVFAHASRAYIAYNSPLEYARRLSRRLLARYPLRVYMFTGRSDPDGRGIGRMAAELRRAGAVASYNLFPGGHDWQVWYAQVDRMMEMASQMVSHPLPVRGPLMPAAPRRLPAGRALPGRRPGLAPAGRRLARSGLRHPGRPRPGLGGFRARASSERARSGGLARAAFGRGLGRAHQPRVPAPAAGPARGGAVGWSARLAGGAAQPHLAGGPGARVGWVCPPDPRRGAGPAVAGPGLRRRRPGAFGPAGGGHLRSAGAPPAGGRRHRRGGWAGAAEPRRPPPRGRDVGRGADLRHRPGADGRGGHRQPRWGQRAGGGRRAAVRGGRRGDQGGLGAHPRPRRRGASVRLDAPGGGGHLRRVPRLPGGAAAGQRGERHLAHDRAHHAHRARLRPARLPRVARLGPGDHAPAPRRPGARAGLRAGAVGRRASPAGRSTGRPARRPTGTGGRAARCRRGPGGGAGGTARRAHRHGSAVRAARAGVAGSRSTAGRCPAAPAAGRL